MNPYKGSSWSEIKKEICTPQQLEEAKIKAEIVSEIIKARENAGYTQKQLEEISGVKQPVISRLEKEKTSPNLDTILKLLLPLGKTLYIGDIEEVHN